MATEKENNAATTRLEDFNEYFHFRKLQQRRSGYHLGGFGKAREKHHKTRIEELEAKHPDFKDAYKVATDWGY